MYKKLLKLFATSLCAFTAAAVTNLATASVSTASILIWLGHPKAPRSILK